MRPIKRGPLPQAIGPVRPRGMPSPLPRDAGVGGGPRTTPIVNQPINQASPTGGAKGPVVQGINTGGPKPAPIAQQTVGPNADVANGVKGNPMANATGPMTPTLGGGMAPASVATMMKKGGKVKSKSSYSSGGGVKSSASKRGDGCAQRGKTKGRMV